MPLPATHSITVADQNDTSTLEAWDDFVCRSRRGHFICLTTWLKSFATYSVPFHLIVARSVTNQIIGGIPVLQYGNRWLGWMLAPFGPVVADGHEAIAAELVSAAETLAREHRMATLQINLPMAESSDDDAACPMLLDTQTPSTSHYLRPNPDPIGGGATQILWVEFPEQSADVEAWEDDLKRSFHKKTRKNIRIAENHRVNVQVCESTDDIKLAFGVIEANGERMGYATRDWHDIGPVLEEQIAKRHAVLHLATHEGEPLGALYCGTAGRRYQTIMQGTMRTNPDMKIGVALHWHAFKTAHQLGLDGCDLSADGNAGIKAFKESFLPTRYKFVEPIRFVFSTSKQQAIKHLLPRVIKHKKLVSAVLKRFSK